MISTQGGEANLSGSFADKVIESIFRERGIQVRPYRDVGKNGDMFAPRFVLRNPPYKSLYDRHSEDPLAQSRSGYLYRQFEKGADIRIVPRWQEETGSADDKLISLFYNARDAMPESEVWLFIGGGGARPEAVAWLKHECANVTNKSIIVIEDVGDLRQRVKATTQYVAIAGA